MAYDPKKHHRRSIRLKGYDYSRAGLYFITICVRHHICLFGHVENGIMILNDAGQMVEKWYYELENKYPDKNCDEMMVMPNHFHCIIENAPKTDETLGDTNVRMPLRGHPTSTDTPMDKGTHEGVPRHGLSNNDPHNDQTNPQYGMDNQKYHTTVGDAMDWFKTMTTNEYIRGVKTKNWKRFDKKLWQLNYWEHIIRDEAEYWRIANYIKNNPKKWGDDRFHRK